MKYADLILPLPLPGFFTYSIPADLDDALTPGHVVVVQFGKRRLYSAVVFKVHNDRPPNQQIKQIDSLVDEKHLVSAIQLRLWEWIATYYMCTIGEVMHAALPSAFRISSESSLVLLKDGETDFTQLDDDEYLVADALALRGELKTSEIQAILNKKTVFPVIKSLIHQGIAVLKEEVTGRFKAKYEKYIQLAPAYEENDEALEFACEELKRATRQCDLLLAFLRMREDGIPISKAALLKNSGFNAAVLKKLLEKEILQEIKVEKGRLKTRGGAIAKLDLFSPAQQTAYEEIKDCFNHTNVVLLHGVTSSGKTLLYLHLIQEQLDKGKQVLYLLPEIALTSQIVMRLHRIFGDKVGAYHSRYSSNERVEIWKKVQEKEYQIILGARSALFLPFADLGLIIVDEEHDPSFKQFDPAPRYHARDTAVVLASLHNAKTLLGTATPSLESYHNAQNGKYGLVELSERYGGMKLPEICIVNLRDQMKKKRMHSHFSSVLINEITQALDNKEQVILFQNRRGYAPYVMCDGCGWIPHCNFCDVTLTYHQFSMNLRCHYCSSTVAMPKNCPECGSDAISVKGFGTEKIEEEITLFFPKARVARLDFDSVRGKEGHERVIGKFERGETDILVGTKMVTKGLDFDNVSVVGILSADQLLHHSDFRASEHAFQLMSQVSGRSGRKFRQGKVIIQAFDSEHPVLKDVLGHNYERFFYRETEQRRQFKYPPFYRVINITLKHKDYRIAESAANMLGAELKNHLTWRVLGPNIPPVSRIRTLYLREILIKVEKDATALTRAKETIRSAIMMVQGRQEFKYVLMQIDVDPY